MPTSKRQQNKPENDNPLKAKVKSARPRGNYLDFKKRELVLEWSDGSLSRYPLSDERFKEFLEEGAPLKNL